MVVNIVLCAMVIYLSTSFKFIENISVTLAIS